MLAKQGQLNQKELQETLGIQPGSISELISKLESKGLVRREKDVQDKRKAILVITEAGKAAADALTVDADEASLYAALTEEEQATLKDLLKKLADSWSSARHS